MVSKEGYRVRPPSMNSVWPVMYAASSEHRNAAAAAISSAPPASATCFRHISTPCSMASWVVVAPSGRPT